MIQKIIKPHHRLRPYIEHYYCLESSGLEEYSAQQRIYPFGKIILVFHYKEPFFFQSRRKAGEQEPRTVICGQQTSFYDLSPAGRSGMIFVVFKSFGASLFFDIPMTDITNQNIALREILKGQSDEVEEKILGAKNSESRIRIIDDFLNQRLVQCYKPIDRLQYSFKPSNGNDNHRLVQNLAARSNWSVKHYERQFSAVTGLLPKKYLQIIRFQNALQLLNSYRSLTYLAMDCGYHDQSHFIHDFKSFTDMTPGQYKKIN